jgi:co-chaperonin GroES (HSP10)
MSTYLNKFKKLKKELGDKVVLRGSSLLIEPVDETKEKMTAGGLYIPEDPDHKLGSVAFNKANVALVVMAGEGYFNPETGEYTPTDVSAGDMIIYKKENAQQLSTFPGIQGITQDKLAIIDENYILYIIKGGEKTLNKAKEILN